MNNKIASFLEKYLGWITVVACILILILPYLLTRKWNLIDFTATGEIGDTIGGTTAPVIGITTIILVYITYKSQKEELEKTREFVIEQNKKIEFEQVVDSIENLIKETLYFIDTLEFGNNKGTGAIRTFNIGSNKENSFLGEFNALLIRFEFLLLAINELENSKVKEDYLARVYTLFYSKILWNAKENFFDNQRFEMKKKNDDASLIIPHYAKLSLESIGYLMKKGLVANSEFKEGVIADLKTEIGSIPYRNFEG